MGGEGDMGSPHWEVDQYGPIDVLSSMRLATDPLESAEMLWHGVLLNNVPPEEASMDNIRGVTLNQILLIYFNVCGQSMNPR